MIALMGGSFLNADGGDFGEGIGEDRVDVDRLEAEVDAVFLRTGGGERGCMWVMFSLNPRVFVLCGPVVTLWRGRGGGVSPPRGWFGSIPKVDSIPMEIGDWEQEAKAEWLRFIEELESRTGRLPEGVLGR
jgi:hypothetical protein